MSTQKYEISATDMAMLRQLTLDLRGSRWFERSTDTRYEYDLWAEYLPKRFDKDAGVFRLEKEKVEALRGGLLDHNVPMHVMRRHGSYDHADALKWHVNPQVASELRPEQQHWLRKLSMLIDPDFCERMEKRAAAFEHQWRKRIDALLKQQYDEWWASLSEEERKKYLDKGDDA
ncbi:ABC-type amino acid transport substrate-binding protein [Inquilinus ginsengisoli]|uniref:hypothetical protein n=1 Tax=Inquilinus ginsengisoli TaxID=363840 RepID=UPI003D22C56B